MFFVVTTGRSGCTSLAKILCQHPFCLCRHEPHPILIKLAAEWRHADLDEDELRCYLAFKGEQMFPHRIGLRLYGESDQKLSFIIPFLAEFGLNTKFIWLIRDGRSVVASMVSRGEYSRLEARIVPHLWAKYRIEGDRTGDVNSEIWQGMNSFEKCCWYWSYTNRVIRADLRRLERNHWMLIRLEEMHAKLEQITQFLDLPYYPLGLERANRNYTRSYEPGLWSNDENAAFDRLCGDEMDSWYHGWRDGKITSTISETKLADYSVKVLRALLSHVAWGSKKATNRVRRIFHSPLND